MMMYDCCQQLVINVEHVQLVQRSPTHLEKTLLTTVIIPQIYTIIRLSLIKLLQTVLLRCIGECGVGFLLKYWRLVRGLYLLPHPFWSCML